MISIPINEVKLFMNHLLCRSTFDAFCVPELSLSTYASFHVDGHILKDPSLGFSTIILAVIQNLFLRKPAYLLAFFIFKKT